MAANMVAEILIRMYLSSPFRYKNKWSVDSYEAKDVEFGYLEINNNSCIFSKMAAKMAAENSDSNVSQFLLLDTKTNEVSIHMKWRT